MEGYTTPRPESIRVLNKGFPDRLFMSALHIWSISLEIGSLVIHNG